jgi:hypothetical protein
MLLMWPLFFRRQAEGLSLLVILGQKVLMWCLLLLLEQAQEWKWHLIQHLMLSLGQAEGWNPLLILGKKVLM